MLLVFLSSNMYLHLMLYIHRYSMCMSMRTTHTHTIQRWKYDRDLILLVFLSRLPGPLFVSFPQAFALQIWWKEIYALQIFLLKIWWEQHLQAFALQIWRKGICTSMVKGHLHSWSGENKKVFFRSGEEHLNSRSGGNEHICTPVMLERRPWGF